MRAKSVILILLSWIVLLKWTSTVVAQGGTVSVVVSTQNSVSNVQIGELRKIFAGEKRNWPGGSSVKLITRTSGTTEHNALLKLLGMSETEYKQYWTAQVYRGDAQSEPVVVPSNGMQKEALNAYPGAIVLMDSADVKPGMKVLKVDGKLPEDAGYPLHP